MKKHTSFSCLIERFKIINPCKIPHILAIGSNIWCRLAHFDFLIWRHFLFFLFFFAHCRFSYLQNIVIAYPIKRHKQLPLCIGILRCEQRTIVGICNRKCVIQRSPYTIFRVFSGYYTCYTQFINSSSKCNISNINSID